MRVLSWNLGHQTHERPLKPVFRRAVRLVAPDVLVLNEYVDGRTRASMKAALAVGGLAHLAVSEAIRGENQILIASRYPVSFGDLVGPEVSSASTSNFLHICIPTAGVELVGLRAPAYTSAADRATYWHSLSETIRGTLSRQWCSSGT
jgi:hypothetical protein